MIDHDALVAYRDSLPVVASDVAEPTGPLLLAVEPPPPPPLLPPTYPHQQHQNPKQQKQTPPPKPPEPFAPDLAAVYAERFQLIVRRMSATTRGGPPPPPPSSPSSPPLRAFEHTVGICRAHYRVDQEAAKRMTADAIKQTRAP